MIKIHKTQLNIRLFTTGLEKLRAQCRPGALRHVKPLRRVQFFGHVHIVL